MDRTEIESLFQKKYLSTGEFAKAINIHPSTIRDWDNKGWLKAHHRTPGGKRCYTPDQVMDYLDGKFACLSEETNKAVLERTTH